MTAAYLSGDAYLAFARQAHLVSSLCEQADSQGGTRAVQALRFGHPLRDGGRDARDAHRPDSRPRVRAAAAASTPVPHVLGLVRTPRSITPCSRNELHTVFGWTIHPGLRPNPRSLRNFPVQANAAEMLRLACIYILDAGVELCAPVHDAVLIRAPLGQLEAHIAIAQQAMSDASADVLSGFHLRTEVHSVRYPDRYMGRPGRKRCGRGQCGDPRMTKPKGATCALAHGSLCVCAHPLHLFFSVVKEVGREQRLRPHESPLQRDAAGPNWVARRHHRRRSARAFTEAGGGSWKGPIPMDWLERAGRTRGKGLHVGIALWLARGLTGCNEVRLSLTAVAEKFGFHHSAACCTDSAI